MFDTLESGNFVESSKMIDEIFQLFCTKISNFYLIHILFLASLDSPLIKNREAKVCTFYKLALNILIGMKRVGISREELAWSTKFLSEITLQPQHVEICERIAITHNINAGNFGLAGTLLQSLEERKVRIFFEISS